MHHPRRPKGRQLGQAKILWAKSVRAKVYKASDLSTPFVFPVGWEMGERGNKAHGSWGEEIVCVSFGHAKFWKFFGFVDKYFWNFPPINLRLADNTSTAIDVNNKLRVRRHESSAEDALRWLARKKVRTANPSGTGTRYSKVPKSFRPENHRKNHKPYVYRAVLFTQF